MAEQSDDQSRALAYPYASPSTSYALAGGTAIDLAAVDVDLSTRTPLLAYGSNAAPEVLARKIADDDDPVPVIRARLCDFDVVYSAHIAAYGAVPATIQGSAGTEVSVFVAHLTGEQLRRVSETEPNYELKQLPGARLRCADAAAPGEIVAYVSRHGCLVDGGGEIALSSIEAAGRRFPALSEPQILERVRGELCPERTVEEFVALAAAEPVAARRWTERLRANARAFDPPAGS